MQQSQRHNELSLQLIPRVCYKPFLLSALCLHRAGTFTAERTMIYLTEGWLSG
ncbi:MAG: hypothetical protein M5U15_01640 [Kiritimatiellae bacterium]|nr:hypothetical protein [Kiritimatiellia bacterium]